MHPLAWLINGTKLKFHLSLMQFIWLKKHPKTLIITVILLFREEILHQKHMLFDSWEHLLQIIDQHIQV